jgi:hypothetical protein
MNIVLAIRVAAVMLPIAAMNAPAQLPGLAPGSRVLLHAHNCYPEDGRWTDRLDRALGTGRRPIVIEQDLAWARDASGAGRSVVSHDADLSGREPSLEEHFFARLRPIMTRALQENRRDTWPVVILHLDFKTNEPEHHEAVWRLLGTYEAWLTTAVRTVDPSVTSPLDAGPLLVLTEQGEGQELRFHARVAAGERLRLFGTVPGPALPDGDDRRARHAALVGTAADTLIPSGATAYRRWVNFPWAAVEFGGQPEAAGWTGADAARLRALVDRAHAVGLWIRFYTLNGHDPAGGPGWSAGYNFGSLAAARTRWRAAIESRVDFVATDQYEAFADELRSR